MPPTSFAQLVRDDEFSDEELADEESILGECAAAQVPRHWLSWHYRSQVESLIAFSNEHYYDHKLSSFPSPLPDGRDNGPAGFGILSHRVNGQFIHSSHPGRPKGLLRTNPIEADAIVADIQHRFEVSPDVSPSIGVVTFNVQQRDLIETKLRDLDNPRITASVDALDGLFIKNLENVQGDERDSILFSVAFSPDEDGNVPLNFGPLNRPGGERRLNVAITRARRQVVMFCSFEPSQLHTDRSRSTGLRHLKEYLELAMNGTGSAELARPMRSTDRHTADIAEALRAAGVCVQTDVGMSDFKIDLALSRADDPDVPLVAVLLDGPSWNGRKTVYDRDLLPTTVLAKMMGWPDVQRVWMPEWLHDRQNVIERLVSAVRSAEPASAESAIADAPASEPAAPATPVGPTVEPEQAAGGATAPASSPDLPGTATRTRPDESDSVEEAGARPEEEHLPAMARIAASSSSDVDHRPATGDRLTEVAEYQPWTEHQFGEREVLEAAAVDPEARDLVHRAVQEICAAEFPIRQGRLRSLVGKAFGFHRVQRSRIDQIDGLLRSSSCDFDDDGFVWAHGTGPQTMTGYRLNSLAKDGIGIEDLPPVEVANLVRAVRNRSDPSTTREDLVRAALTELGGRRLTQLIRNVIEQAIDSSGIVD
ncbi:AAA domain-containing protein [Acidipropionibacterium jensenii]|nr:AAA domain-containing protein [Acidipropionibacterium jensenii]